MSNPLPRIGILHDSRSVNIAETYIELLKQSAYRGCQSNSILFDLHQPERCASALHELDVVFVLIGIPGGREYQKHLHGFLDLFTMVPNMPAAGVVTHDTEHTRYMIDRWLNASAKNSLSLPDGILSIIDASRPVRLLSLEKAVQVLLKNAPKDKRTVKKLKTKTGMTVDSVSISDQLTIFSRELT